jgi:hypothetical protein
MVSTAGTLHLQGIAYDVVDVVMTRAELHLPGETDFYVARPEGDGTVNVLGVLPRLEVTELVPGETLAGSQLLVGADVYQALNLELAPARKGSVLRGLVWATTDSSQG